MALGLGKMAKKIGSGARSIGSSENIKKAGQVAGLANSNIGKSGGYKKLLGHAGTGAIAGGLSGAGINTLRGEDAWEGAKTGATLGAIGNAGTKGFKMAAGATGGSMKDAYKSFGKQMGQSGKPKMGPLQGPVNRSMAYGQNLGPRQGPSTSSSIFKPGPPKKPNSGGGQKRLVGQAPTTRLNAPVSNGLSTSVKRKPKIKGPDGEILSGQSFTSRKEVNSGVTKSVGALQTMSRDSNQANQMMRRR